METPIRGAVRCPAGRALKANVAARGTRCARVHSVPASGWVSEPKRRKECVTLFIGHSELSQSVAPSPAGPDAQLVYMRCRASYLIYDRCGNRVRPAGSPVRRGRGSSAVAAAPGIPSRAPRRRGRAGPRRPRRTEVAAQDRGGRAGPRWPRRTEAAPQGRGGRPALASAAVLDAGQSVLAAEQSVLAAPRSYALGGWRAGRGGVCSSSW